MCESECPEPEGGNEGPSWEIAVGALLLLLLIVYGIRWIILSITGFDVGF